MMESSSTQFSEIMIIIGCVLIIIFLAVFIVTVVCASNNRRKKRDAMLTETYNTVCAGSSHHPSAPMVLDAPSVDYNEFRSKTGKILNPEDFYKFVVDGNSMQFCGIHDKDLIFVPKGFTLSKIKQLPALFVLHRDAIGNQPQYKLRRGWKICMIDDDLEKIINTILKSQQFKDLREEAKAHNSYDSDELLKKDFFEYRLERYKGEYINCDFPKENNRQVLISTTFHTDENTIRFSIHPVASIVGIVEEAFAAPAPNKE